MRHILTLALALLAGSASAQPTTTPTPVPRPACYPMVNGYPVGLPHVVNGNLGIHTYWACSDAKGATPEVYGFFCPHAQCSSIVMSGVITSITRATARVGTANAAWDEHIKFHCNGESAKEQSDTGRLCLEWLNILHSPLSAAWRASLPKGTPN